MNNIKVRTYISNDDTSLVVSELDEDAGIQLLISSVFKSHSIWLDKKAVKEVVSHLINQYNLKWESLNIIQKD